MERVEFISQDIQESEVKQESAMAEYEDFNIHQQHEGTSDDGGNILMKDIKHELTSDGDNDKTLMSDNIECHNSQVLFSSECINKYDDVIDIKNDTQMLDDVKFDMSKISDNVGGETAPGALKVGKEQASSDDDNPLQRLRSKKRVKLIEDTECGPALKKQRPITSEQRRRNTDPAAAHHKDRQKFSCHQCSYNTTNKCHLKAHLLTHTDEKPFSLTAGGSDAGSTPGPSGLTARGNAGGDDPPSPAMFVESEVAASPPSSTLQHPPPPGSRRLQDEDISNIINYGSEEDSSEDEEATIPIPCIPRVFRSMMETPLDMDEDAAGEDTPASTAESDDPNPTATEQPWSLFDFEWKPFPDCPIQPESRRETFSQTNVGPTTPHVDPYDIFIDIWDRQIMEHIASETNKYAQQVAAQMFENNTLHPRSRISKWVDTTVDELYVLFGVILAMGIVVKSRIEEYWSATPDIFCTPGFSAQMSIDRFLLLCKCLHFNDNEDMRALELDDSEAKLFKIRPILSHLGNKFQELYIPRQNIALDESLSMWKGWLEIGQLIPNKAARKGIKTYEICESQTGYLWRFEVHSHKRSPPQQIVDPLKSSTPSIVLRLTRGLEQKGYTLWMDNFYNSPCLARQLKSLGFDCVGTLRTDRKFVPQALHSLTKRNMRPGQVSGLTSGDVDVMVWRDADRVAMISTYHGNGQPILISDYNITMGGLDKKDQLLAMYPVERKLTKVWYKKLFRRLLNVSVLNSYIIHRQNSSSSSLSHRKFRMKQIKSLISKHSASRSAPLVPTQKQRVDVTHRVAEFPMRNHQRLRRACTACRKLVRTFCVGCDGTVCMDPCFLTIHS